MVFGLVATVKFIHIPINIATITTSAFWVATCNFVPQTVELSPLEFQNTSVSGFPDPVYGGLALIKGKLIQNFSLCWNTTALGRYVVLHQQLNDMPFGTRGLSSCKQWCHLW